MESTKLCAFGEEDVRDLTGDHGLMRLVLLQCIDRQCYGGAIMVSRTHFDTPERPERMNVFVVRGGGALLEESLGKGAFAGAPPIPPRAGGGDRADLRAVDVPEDSQSRSAQGGMWGRVFERLCEEDVAAVYDGENWVPMRVQDCVLRACRAFVGTASRYVEANRERVHDIAPAIDEICDGFRMGSYRHYSELTEAVARMLDKHALTPAEFLKKTGI